MFETFFLPFSNVKGLILKKSVTLKLNMTYAQKYVNKYKFELFKECFLLLLKNLHEKQHLKMLKIA